MSTMPYNYSYNGATALSYSLQSSVQRSKFLSKQYDKNNLALATGKDVNTPYDDSIRFFKDAHLSEKAAGINAVLDNIGTVVSTLSSVDSNLTTLSDLIALAKGVANEAATTADTPATVIGDIPIKDVDTLVDDISTAKTGDIISVRTGIAEKATSSLEITKKTTLKELGIGNGELFTLKLGDGDWQSFSVTNENMTVDRFMQNVVTQIGEDKVSYEIKDGELSLETTDKSSLIFGSHHYDPVTQQLDTTDTSPTVAGKLGFASEQLITVEAGDTVQTLLDKLNALDGISAKMDKNDKMQISSVYGDDLVVADFHGRTADAFGVNSYSRDGTNEGRVQSNAYNELLQQIDAIIEDSIYDGVNLLQGDSIRAVFNDTATAYRQIYGIKLDTKSLGLPTAVNEWKNPDDIADTLDALDKAAQQVKAAANYFDRAAAMVASRQDFLSSLSETFQAGGDSLVNADLNEVSANLLSINTEQSIASEVISITLQNNSNILSLFG